MSSPIPINYATAPGRFTLNLRVSKTFGFGQKKEANARGAGGPGGGGGFGRGPGAVATATEGPAECLAAAVPPNIATTSRSA